MVLQKWKQNHWQLVVTVHLLLGILLVDFETCRSSSQSEQLLNLVFISGAYSHLIVCLFGSAINVIFQGLLFLEGHILAQFESRMLGLPFPPLVFATINTSVCIDIDIILFSLYYE